MAAFTAIALGVAAVAGVAGTVMQVNAQKKAAKKQEQQLAAQKTAAKEAAQQQTTREDTGAKVKLGSDDNAPLRASGGGSGQSTASRTGSVKAAVGGLGASKRLGL